MNRLSSFQQFGLLCLVAALCLLPVGCGSNNSQVDALVKERRAIEVEFKAAGGEPVKHTIVNKKRQELLIKVVGLTESQQKEYGSRLLSEGIEP